MTLIYIIIGIIFGYSIFIFMNKEKFSKCNNLDERDKKILKLIEERGKITNNEVESHFNVSDATATRYLQKLEDKNLITQEGKIGRGVFYKKL